MLTRNTDTQIFKCILCLCLEDLLYSLKPNVFHSGMGRLGLSIYEAKLSQNKCVPVHRTEGCFGIRSLGMPSSHRRWGSQLLSARYLPLPAWCFFPASKALRYTITWFIGGHTSLLPKPGKNFFCAFFLFFSLPLFICVELEKLSRWNIVKCKGLLHTSVALMSQAPSILEKQPFCSCCLFEKCSLLRLSRLFLHILEFFVGFPQNDFSEETCE